MHEMSLVYRIIDIAQNHAVQNNAMKITKIVLTLGSMSGVMYESLMFSFNIAIQKTMLEEAEICVDKIPAKGKCQHCQHEYLLSSLYDECPICRSKNPLILQGKEFAISSITII